MKRGAKPGGNVNVKWGPKFAYAIGLLVSDGCLSKDGRHVIMTSKDKDQLTAFDECLDIENKVKIKFSGNGDVSYYTQFSDVLFYKFLMKIGLMPAKSKTISALCIPTKYFMDFLRGYFDGDGCSYSYYDPVYRNSYRFYISFASGSEIYIQWLRDKIFANLKIKGSIGRKRGSTNVQLRYSKKEAGILAKKMYYHRALICLQRKRIKIMRSLKVIRDMSEW